MSSRILSEHLCQLRSNDYPQFIHHCGTKPGFVTNAQTGSNPPENDWKTPVFWKAEGLFTNIVCGFLLII